MFCQHGLDIGRNHHIHYHGMDEFVKGASPSSSSSHIPRPHSDILPTLVTARCSPVVKGTNRRTDERQCLQIEQAQRNETMPPSTRPGIWNNGHCFHSVHPVSSSRIVYSMTLDEPNQNNVWCSKFRALAINHVNQESGLGREVHLAFYPICKAIKVTKRSHQPDRP